jgi:hypothetical protein
MMEFIDPQTDQRLSSLYEEVMWLASRPNITPSMARAWYTHVVANRLRGKIRFFSGKVSSEALTDPQAVLRLEHHARIQTTLTSLVSTNIKHQDKEHFIRTLLECENVHIVTFAENYAAMRHKGDYKLAGIKLVSWSKAPAESRKILWSKMLRGKVANASTFAPKPELQA